MSPARARGACRGRRGAAPWGRQRTTHARSWGPYTLDGRSVLAPADGKAPDDPLAWPARSFLDLVAEDAGVARRLDQVPGLAAFRLEARGFFHGALRCGCAVVC